MHCNKRNATRTFSLRAFHGDKTHGKSLPSWLVSHGATALLRKYVRNKQDPLVEAVQLLEANPQFSGVLFPDGRETTVSTSDLTSSGQQEIALDQKHDESESCPELSLPSQQTETVTPDGGRSPEMEHTAMRFFRRPNRILVL